MRILAACLALASLHAPASSAERFSECPALRGGPLSLAEAEERLAACNREVRASAAALAGAEADRMIAGQRPNPTLTLGANNLNPAVGVGPGSLRDKTFDSSVRVEQVIERGGKAGLRERQAQASLAAARADLADVLRVQRLAMRSAYFDLFLAQERVGVQREFAALADESRRAVDRRLEAGDVSRADANRIRLDAIRAANDLRQSEVDLERARNELARMIGAEARPGPMEVAYPDLVRLAPSRAPGDERPDVAAARRRVEAAEAGRDLARSISTRDVTVGLQADRWPVSEANPQGTGTSYGFTVSIPLHVRHANEGEARRALADLDAARIALARAEALAAAEARLAETDWLAWNERVTRTQTEILPVARDVAKAAEFAYSRGATGVLDLLDARRSLRAVELDAAGARAEAGKAWARREAANEAFKE